MNEKEFFKTITENESLWVAIKGKEALILSDAEGNSALPVWANRENAANFIAADSIDSLAPFEIPMSNFSRVWLAEGFMEFGELIIDPKPEDNKHMVITKEEFSGNIEQS